MFLHIRHPDIALRVWKDEVIHMEEAVTTIIENEIIPFVGLGIASGVALGTVFSLLAYGIFKAISLLNIKNY